jgi:hypothetical protein
MTTHSVYEPEDIYDVLDSDKVKVGDHLEYISNNQEGYAKYKVVKGTDGQDKSLHKVGDIYGDHDDGMSGGMYDMAGGMKRKTRRRRKKTMKHKMVKGGMKHKMVKGGMKHTSKSHGGKKRGGKSKSKRHTKSGHKRKSYKK